MDKLNKYIDKIYYYYTKNDYENSKKKIFVLLNTLTLLFCINKNICVPLTLLLFVIYYKCSKLDPKEKKKIILTWITFSIMTLFGESLVILISNNALTYSNTTFFNVPFWLLTAYASMIMSIILNMEFYDIILN